MKHLFKSVILTLGVLFMTFSCQKEDQILNEESNIQTIQDGLNIELLDWHDLINDNSEISKKINLINDKNSGNRVSSVNYDFSIDETLVQIIEQENGSTSYTFLIHRDNQPDYILENYVYEVYPNGEVNQFIFTYQFSFDEDGSLVFDENYLDIQTIEDESLVFSRGDGCEPEFVDVSWETTCEIRLRCTGTGAHEAGDSECLCDTSPTCVPAGISCYEQPVYNYSNCTGGNPYDDNDTNPNNSPNPGGGGDPNNPNNPPNNDHVPLAEEYINSIETCINGVALLGDNTDTTTIDFGLIDNLNLTEGALYRLKKFLNINGCSEEAQQEVIDGLVVIFDEEIFVDEGFKNNDCLKSVYDDMGKASRFKEYLQNFKPASPVAHLRFSTSSIMQSDVNAETSTPNNYLIKITFNENNLDRPRLSIARTFIHELIHAEIFRKLLSVWQHPSLEGITESDLILFRNDYPGLYDYYIRWINNIPSGMNASSAQHQAMAQHYRNIIKQALVDFDSTQTIDVYEALSWVGLKDTVAWNNLTQTERDNLDQILSTFESNNPNCQ